MVSMSVLMPVVVMVTRRSLREREESIISVFSVVFSINLYVISLHV